MLNVRNPDVLQVQVTLWMLGVLSNGRAYDLTTVRPPPFRSHNGCWAFMYSAAIASEAVKQPLHGTIHASMYGNDNEQCVKHGRPSLLILCRSCMRIPQCLTALDGSMPECMT